jgi:hypothetical protein
MIPIVSLSLIVFSVITVVVGIYKIHSLPGDIARQRQHPQSEAITVCSILGLIVFPLWMAALVWAYAGVVGTPYIVDDAGGVSPLEGVNGGKAEDGV